METLKVIRETLFYIQQFKDSVFVIRLGDKIVDRVEELGILRDISLLRDIGIKIVIFHSASNLRIDKWTSIKNEIYQQDFSQIQNVRIAIKSDLLPVVYCSSSSCSVEKMVCDMSVKLCAKKIIFVTHYDGIYGEDRRLISEMTVEEAEKLLDKKNILNGRAREKVEAAINACKEKIPRVHIINGGRDGSLLKEIFFCEGIGTMIYARLPYQDMRTARESDISNIINILRNSKVGRSLKHIDYPEITKQIKNFVVYAVDEQVHGCFMATYEKEPPLMKIDYLAVSQTYEDSDALEKMLENILSQAREKELNYVIMEDEKNLIWLGMYPWFLNLGFQKFKTSDLSWYRKKDEHKNVWLKTIRKERETNHPKI